MTDLVETNQNWNYIDSNITLVSKIREFDSVSLERCTKWKDYVNQVVINTPKYYYKVYQELKEPGSFLYLIRETLAEIYRDYGVHWEIRKINEHPYYYHIEQREKLQLCTPDIISYEELFYNWSITLKELEKRLGLNKILYQIRDKYPQVKYVKLIRDCVNKFSDYAIKNNHVILLDDADWFIALVDQNGEWISLDLDIIPVMLNSYDMVLAPQHFYNNDQITLTGEKFNKFLLFNNNTNFGHVVKNLKSQREQMLSDNIKYIVTNKLPHSGNLYLQDEVNEIELLMNK